MKRDDLQEKFLSKEPASSEDAGSGPGKRGIEPAGVAIVEILNRVEHEPYHWPVGRTTFQKIAYVATREGLPTGLHFQKGIFGPFSRKLKGLIKRLANNGLIREELLGRMFEIKVGQTFKDARNTYHKDLERWESTIEKIADLFMRLQTKQSEVVATVLFAADMLSKTNEESSELDVLDGVMMWKQKRRPPLDKGEVAYIIRNLAALKWLDVRPSSDLPIPEEALDDI